MLKLSIIFKHQQLTRSVHGGNFRTLETVSDKKGLLIYEKATYEPSNFPLGRLFLKYTVQRSKCH